MKMPRYVNPFEPQQENKPERSNALERLAIFASAIITLTVALLGEEGFRFWVLVALALLLIGIVSYQSIKESLKVRYHRFRDERVAKRRFPDFRRFVHRFGDFVHHETPHPTLHKIVRVDVCQSSSTTYDKLAIPRRELFERFWGPIRNRVDKAKPNLDSLLELNSEFDNLVGLYANEVVEHVFGRFPQELQTLLTDRAKSSLNSFQQRFAAFIDNYSYYLKELDDSLSAPQIGDYYFYRPDPL